MMATSTYVEHAVLDVNELVRVVELEPGSLPYLMAGDTSDVFSLHSLALHLTAVSL